MKADKDPPLPLSVNRRSFFRELLARGLDHAEQAGRTLSGRISDVLGDVEPAKPFLRPPGALGAEDFASTCSRSGNCVIACPAQAIRLEIGSAGGLPFIVARDSPCVVCDELACMKACPSGALAPLPVATLINMGTARMDFDRCIRTHDGDECRACIEHCPIGETAIGIDDKGAIDVREGCIGCGVCEHECPTDPASIVIVPQA